MAREIGNWPIEYRKELLVGDLGRSVALCSLWSDREYAAGQVGLENVVVVGNLYSHGPGIEGIVRNLLANPAIRTIVLAGKDKSKSAETLVQLFDQGVERTKSGWTIPLAKEITPEDLPPGMRTLDKAIPLEAIESLRRNVEIVDLRGKSWEDVAKLVASCEVAAPFAKPSVYPKTEPEVEVMMGEDIGFVFRGDRPHEVWLEILRTIRQFGYQGESQWTSNTQEVLNITAILEGELDEMMVWPSWVGHSPQAVRDYSRQLIEGVALDAEDSYAYGERMRARKGDQIDFLIKQLKENPYSRRMLIDLWDAEGDWFGRSESPPCLTQVWFRVFRDKLCATFSYRSHDMYGAWLKNAMGDRLLQAHVAREAGLPLGSTTIISYSAHIYEHDFVQIDELLKEHPLRWKFVEDPRGNVIITVENGEIVVRHENRSGAVTVMRGTTARGLYKRMWRRKLISRLDHAMYLGNELARAEQDVKEGKTFVQDKV